MSALPRLIFVVSPGRCGTRYLRDLMACIPGIRAVHEPDPQFAASAWAAQWLPGTAAEFWLETKLPAIRQSGEWLAYVETSHVFAHGHCGTLFDLGIPFNLIFLSRDKQEVALSYWRRKSIPMRTERGFLYLLNPANPNNLCPVDNDLLRRATDYQLCYWHALEIEARACKWRRRAHAEDIPVADVTLDQLNSEGGMIHIVEALDLPEPDWHAVARIVGKPVNATPEELPRAGKQPANDVEMARWQTEIIAALS